MLRSVPFVFLLRFKKIDNLACAFRLDNQLFIAGYLQTLTKLSDSFVLLSTEHVVGRLECHEAFSCTESTCYFLTIPSCLNFSSRLILSAWRNMIVVAIDTIGPTSIMQGGFVGYWPACTLFFYCNDLLLCYDTDLFPPLFSKIIF